MSKTVVNSGIQAIKYRKLESKISQAYWATHLADSVEWEHHEVAPKMINNY